MPKIRSNRAAKKRFRVTGGGKIMRNHAYKSHILTKMTRKRKRNLGKAVEVLMNDGTKKRGILDSADESRIVLKEEEKQKNKKSKKMVVGEPLTIEMSDIKQTKSIIVF